MTELKTIVELYNDDNRRSEVMERAGEILKKGGLVAFPTNQKQLRHLKKLKSGSMKHMMTSI